MGNKQNNTRLLDGDSVESMWRNLTYKADPEAITAHQNAAARRIQSKEIKRLKQEESKRKFYNGN